MKHRLLLKKASQDIQANITKGWAYVKEAVANIVCFSELAFTPFYAIKWIDYIIKR